MTEAQGPDKAAQPAPKALEKPQKTPRRPGRLVGLITLSLAFIALLVAGGGVGAGYYVWREFQHSQQTQQDELARLEKDLLNLSEHPDFQSLRRTLSDEARRAQGEDQKQQKALDTLKNAITQVHELSTRDQRGWAIAETEYLIRIANHRLRLMRDFDGAIAALEAADQRLHHFADPRLLPVREILADEIQTLKAFKRPDLVGIALKLDRMSAHLQPLPLNYPTGEGMQVVELSGDEEPGKGLGGLAGAVWNEFSSLVTIRHHDQPVEALPDAETELHMHQLLRLRLEAARIAVMRQDNDEYHRQLDAAQVWVKEYYRGEDAERLAGELDTLKQADLRPELPDITASLDKLQALARPRPTEAPAP